MFLAGAFLLFTGGMIRSLAVSILGGLVLLAATAWVISAQEWK